MTHVATALSGIVTARALGPEGKGVVAGVLAWPQLTGWVLLLGLGSAMSLRVAESRQTALPDVLGNALVYCLSVGLLGTVLGLALLPGALDHLGPSASGAARISVLTIPVSMLGEVLLGINLSLGRTRRYNAARILGGLTVLAISVVLVIAGAATPLTVVAGTFVGGVVSSGVAAGRLPWRRLAVALQCLRSDLAYGLRVFLTSFLGLVNLRLDVLVMTAFLAASEIGWYTVAVNVMMPIAVVTTAAASLIMPAIGGLRGSRGVESSADVSSIRRIALRYSMLTVPVAATLAALIPWAVPLVFGRAFEPAVALSWILLPGFIAHGYTYIVDQGLVGMRKPWVGNATQGVGVVATLTLLPLLLPRYGATGAAITSTVSYTVSAAMATWALGRVQRSVALAPDAIAVAGVAHGPATPPEASL